MNDTKEQTLTREGQAPAHSGPTAPALPVNPMAMPNPPRPAAPQAAPAMPAAPMGNAMELNPKGSLLSSGPAIPQPQPPRPQAAASAPQPVQQPVSQPQMPSPGPSLSAPAAPSMAPPPAAPMRPKPIDDETETASDHLLSQRATIIHHRPEPAPAAPAGSHEPVPAPGTDATTQPSQDMAPVKRPLRIGEKLISLGLISDDQLQVALQEQKQRKKLLGAILVEMGFITESALGEVLAESAGTKQFNLKTAVLDPALVKRIPKEIANRQKIVAVSQEGDVINLAMSDVYNVLAIDQVRRFFDRRFRLEPLYCNESDILELIDQYYDYELSIDGILKEIETGIRESGNLDGAQEGYINPTVRLVNAILVDAIKVGASDIHFEPENQFLRLRYRRDGNLEQIRTFHRDYWAAIAVRIKIVSGMNIAEQRQPQDGRIAFHVMGREVDFRVATQPTVHGENIVMRLLDKTKSLVPLEQLGFSDHNIELLKKLIKRPEGIIIVTGPTGSGKTTSLYSILSYINSMNVNIMTLEDPVEYQLPLIRQTNVREGSVDFHSGIKSLMRQDPDIIFVGEVRDEDTALMAVRAALTGHQVYTTLHTNDALGAIPRLGDIGVPAHLLAGSLICTMAQRLARKLCDNCKRPRLATPEEARILGFMPDEPPTIHDPVGCPSCKNKGYKGRTAIIEILRVDEGLNELIATHATRNTMLEYALENGFITMVEDGIDKVVKGEIDLAQLIATIDMTERL